MAIRWQISNFMVTMSCVFICVITYAVLQQDLFSEGKIVRAMAHPKGFRWTVDFPPAEIRRG